MRALLLSVGCVLLTQAPTETLKVRAQYAWGYAGKDGTGKGTLAVALDAATGNLVVELHGLGERLMLLQGQEGSGFHLLLPRRELDTRASSLSGLPVPFLPQVGSVKALAALLAEGKGPGVSVSKRDAQGPRKMKYVGRDEQGHEVMVWLDRTCWERE